MTKQINHILDTDSIFKLLLRLSIPSMISLLVMLLYTMTDTIFISRFAGTDGTAAIVAIYPVFLFANAIAISYGVGTASNYTRSIGGKDHNRADQIVANSFVGSVLIGLFLLGLGFVFKDSILYFFGLEKVNLMSQLYMMDYYKLMIFGFVTVMISTLGINLLNANGDALFAMLIYSGGMVINIVLDPIFIFDWGLGLGVKGAALASIVGQVVSIFFLLLYMKSKTEMVKWKKFRPSHFSIKLQQEIVTVGLPSFLSNVSDSLISPILIVVLSMVTVSQDQTTFALAIRGIGNQIVMISVILGVGVVQGMAPIISYNFAAKKFDRVIKVVKYAHKLIIALTMIVGIFIFLYTETFVQLYLSDSYHNIEMFYLPLRVVLISVLFIANNLILYTWYQAVGDVKASVFIVLLRTFIFIVPSLLILPSYFQMKWGEGLWGVWLSYPISSFLTYVVCKYKLVKELRQYDTLKD